jgi:ankyrin repeat protein
MNLGKLHNLPTKTVEVIPENTDLFSPAKSRKQLKGISRVNLTQNQIPVEEKSLAKEVKDTWKWKYTNPKPDKEYYQHSLIYLIIERDWQGALSLILNDLERFHLNYIQILEAAILNNKLNLVLRLLLRIKDKNILHSKNSQRQNLFHLLANMNEYDENLFQQILSYLHEYHIDWNIADKYGSYPIHYACVQHNFILINFLHEKYSIEFNLNQTDLFENTAIGLLFWKIASKTSFSNESIRLLIKSNKQLNCLCNYDNDIAMNPLSFGYIEPLIEKLVYPPIKSDNSSTNVRTSPLINAIVYNNFPLAKFLLELGADVNFPDEEKRTPLMHAVLQVNKNLIYNQSKKVNFTRKLQI